MWSFLIFLFQLDVFRSRHISLDVEKIVFMDCHGIIALLKALAISTQEEVIEVKVSNEIGNKQ
jgi:hypothetical protein